LIESKDEKRRRKKRKKSKFNLLVEPVLESEGEEVVCGVE